MFKKFVCFLAVSLMLCSCSFAENNLNVNINVQNEKPSRNFSNGRINEDYESKIRSDTPCTWELVDGELPEGLELEGLDGEEATLKGKPTEPGEYNFTLRREDAEGTEDRDFNIKIVDEGEEIPEPEEFDAPEGMQNDDAENIKKVQVSTTHDVNLGGGCETGFGIFGLVILCSGLIFRRK